jgi:hypothetical protein
VLHLYARSVKAMLEVLDTIMAVKAENARLGEMVNSGDASARSLSSRHGEEVAALQNELGSVTKATAALRQELIRRDELQSACVSMEIQASPEAIADTNSRMQFKDAVINDVARALAVDLRRIDMVGMIVEESSKPSVGLDLHFLPSAGKQEGEAGSVRLASQLAKQVQDSESPFNQSDTGRNTTSLKIITQMELVERLRKTIQILQEECLKAPLQVNETERLRAQIETGEEKLRQLNIRISVESAQKSSLEVQLKDSSNTIATLRAQMRTAIERFDRAEDANVELRHTIERLQIHLDERMVLICAHVHTL